jgi:hypothetical protein
MTPRRAGFVFGLWFYKDFAPTVLRQTAADEVRAVLGVMEKTCKFMEQEENHKDTPGRSRATPLWEMSDYY